MGRYRPPAREQARYITPEGARALRKELDYLWRVQRPQVTQAVREAAAQGDRSENAEYIYGKKQLREIDRRVRYLQKRLDVLKIVDSSEHRDTRVYFGAWVSVEDEAGAQQTYRLVGPDEIDLASGLISVESPMARALLGKTEGDEVIVQRPTGNAVYYVLQVSYQPRV